MRAGEYDETFVLDQPAQTRLGRNWRDALVSPTTTSYLCLLLLLITLSHFAFASDSMHSSEIDAIFRSAGLDATNSPGAAVSVIKHGEVVFERGYGVTDLRSLRKIDGRTNFRLASLTKQFTAMATMLLVHDGTLHYDDRLTDIFSDFPAYGKRISIRNLLNHTSGLKDYEDLMPPEPAAGTSVDETQIRDAGVLELLRRQTSTNFNPGSKWAYTNSGYVLLGLIVSKVSGQSFPEFLHNRIFAPLGMTNTIAFERGKNEIANRALGYSLESGTWKETDQSPTSATLGDGGVYSSVTDLAKWDRALRLYTLLGELEMRPAITPVKVSQGQVTAPGGKAAEYGFGWFLDPYKGHKRMWHYGETMGFRTAIQRLVGDELTIIVLCNRTDLNPTAVALRVADIFLDSKLSSRLKNLKENGFGESN